MAPALFVNVCLRFALTIVLATSLAGIARAESPAEESRTLESPPLSDDDNAGLPTHAGPFRVYARDPDAPLNVLHQLLFVSDQVAKEVGAALPEERRRGGLSDADFFRTRWYFEKRPGEEPDRRLFGGDVRISPITSWSADRTPRLLEVLKGLATREQVEQVPGLKNPLARLLLQWDLLSVWWRLELQADSPPEVLTAMARSIRALGQSRATLSAIPSGGTELRRMFSGGDATETIRPFLPEDFLDANGEPTGPELARKSTRLFHAETQMRAARVFLRMPQTDVERLLKGESSLPAAPPPRDRPLLTALVLTLMAIDDQGKAVATPVIDELRIRAVLDPEGDADAFPTSSRDGSSHWIYVRSRRQSLVDVGQGPFRFVPDTNQSLFLEYGTAKHTTYFAQCALCHRLQGGGNQAPLGIRSLSKQAATRLARSATERAELAEQELQTVAERLARRLSVD